MMYTPIITQTLDAKCEQPDFYHKQKIRAAIYQSAGDLETLVGTLSDAVHLLLTGFIDLVTQLNQATSLAEVRAASEPLQQRFIAIAQKIENKSLQFPFQIKSIEEVIHEIIQRSQAVTEVFIQTQAAQASALTEQDHA